MLDAVVDVLDVILDNHKSQRRNPGDVSVDVKEHWNSPYTILRTYEVMLFKCKLALFMFDYICTESCQRPGLAQPTCLRGKRAQTASFNAAKAHKCIFHCPLVLTTRLAARAASFSPWVRATSVACAHAWSLTSRWVRTRLAWRKNVPAVRQGLSSSAQVKSWSLCRSPAGHRPPLELSEIENILLKDF